MKNIKVLILATIFHSFYLAAEPYAQRGLLILLDESEKLQEDVWNPENFGAVTNNLLDALEEKVPILITASLFNNFLVAREIFHDFAKLSTQELAAKYKNPPKNDPLDLDHYKQDIERIYALFNWITTSIEQYAQHFPHGTADELTEHFNQHNLPDEKFNNFGLELLSAAASTYTPSEWINKQASQGLYLLIPRKYYEKEIPELVNYTSVTKTAELTELELKLGLKIDHMPDIPESQLTHANMQSIPQSDFNYKDIFVTKNEYAQANKKRTIKIMPPTWAIYLVGHGTNPFPIENFIDAASTKIEKAFFQNLKNQGLTSVSYLADFSIFQLRKFLNFLATKLRTTLFMIDACYIGGQNIAALIQNFGKTITEKTYPFTFIAGGITQAPTTYTHSVISLPPNVFPESIDLKKKRFINAPLIKIGNFFNMLKTHDTINYLELIKTTRDFSGRTIGNITNLPQIKPAGLEWMQALDVPGKVVSIQKILAATHKGELDISTFFGGRIATRETGTQFKEKTIYPEALLLYAENIPFSLKISKNPREEQSLAIISMVPQTALHSIDKINAPQFSLENIMSAFFAVPDLDTEKIFYIKEIVTQDYPDRISNVFVVNNAPHKGSGDRVNGVYFTMNNKQYSIIWNPQEHIPHNPHQQAQLDSYLADWQKYIQQKYPQTFSELEQSVKTIETTLHTPEIHWLGQNLSALAQSLSLITLSLVKS